jgi:hypothetical protein
MHAAVAVANSSRAVEDCRNAPRSPPDWRCQLLHGWLAHRHAGAACHLLWGLAIRQPASQPLWHNSWQLLVRPAQRLLVSRRQHLPLQGAVQLPSSQLCSRSKAKYGQDST